MKIPASSFRRLALREQAAKAPVTWYADLYFPRSNPYSKSTPRQEKQAQKWYAGGMSVDSMPEYIREHHFVAHVQVGAETLYTNGVWLVRGSWLKQGNAFAQGMLHVLEQLSPCRAVQPEAALDLLMRRRGVTLNGGKPGRMSSLPSATHTKWLYALGVPEERMPLPCYRTNIFYVTHEGKAVLLIAGMQMRSEKT